MTTTLKGAADLALQRPPGSEAEQFAYKATQYHPSRPPIWPLVRSEEFDLRDFKGKVVWASVTELAQNFPLVRWGINFFTGFTASFEFQPRIDSDNEDLALEANAQIKAWHFKRTRKKTFDVQRRMSREQMFRTWAALKLWYGDTIMTLSDGGKCQLFEAWNIAKGSVGKLDNQEQIDAALAEIAMLNDNGLWCDRIGSTLGYGIATGDSTGGLTHRMIVPVDAAVYSGAFVRPSAVRPASPLAPAINFARDFMNNIQFKLTLAQIQSLFGLAIFRDHSIKGGADFSYSPGPSPSTAPSGLPQSVPQRPPLQYELRSGLPIKLELEKDEKVEFLESKTPSAEWLNFQHEIGRMVLSVLNIPYSAYDSRQTNFSAQRGDFNIFKNTVAEPERDENADCMAEVDEHVLNAGIEDGTLTALPAVKKLGLKNLEDFTFAEIPRAAFILDDTKEWDAVMRKVAGGFATAEDGCHEMGSGDFYEITRRRGKEQAYQRAKGAMVVVGLPGSAINTDSGQNDKITSGNKPKQDSEAENLTISVKAAERLGWVTINGNHVLLPDGGSDSKETAPAHVKLHDAKVIRETEKARLVSVSTNQGQSQQWFPKSHTSVSETGEVHASKWIISQKEAGMDAAHEYDPEHPQHTIHTAENPPGKPAPAMTKEDEQRAMDRNRRNQEARSRAAEKRAAERGPVEHVGPQTLEQRAAGTGAEAKKARNILASGRYTGKETLDPYSGQWRLPK